MMTSQFSPTSEELLLADKILLKVHQGRVKREDPVARLDADSAVKLFLTTELPPQVLSKIWSEADIGEKGWLTSLDHSLLVKVGPLAAVAGLGPQIPPKDSTSDSAPAIPPKTLSTPSKFPSNFATSGKPTHSKKVPPNSTAVTDSSETSPSIIPFISSRARVTRADLQKWDVPASFTSHCHELFEKNDHSQKGYLDAKTEALPLFRKAKLTDDQLSRIWHVLGVEHSGQFSKDSFVGGLYLVYRLLAGLEIPVNLPESFVTMFSTPSEFTDPFDHTVSSSASGQDEQDEVGGLYAQIRNLQDTLMTVGQENEDLRSSVQTLMRLSWQHNVSQNHMSRNADSSLVEIARLQAELQEKDKDLTRLRASSRITEELSRENTIFRLQIEELTSRLEVSHGDVAAQKLVAEELTRESERLKQQLDEFRETSTHVPSVTGDQELQNLINEDLSRENRRLRNQARGLQESLSQLRAPNDELESLKKTTRELTRENRRLQRRVREMESSPAAQDGVRRQVEHLSRDNERLRRDLEQARRSAHQDLPPPSYEDIRR
ncbi:hypothetical protein GGU10DRAFT_340004 [Lentinula aff. detonsa]|uniref:EH domain-containing protein n=1 Tax=Lentinula aff. detonsa TaxID=2804958 RepID=A0AA38NT66_9AGAR|nr:hypothetical protein GGU10DRAFT_340004 [Lentinula aff. detonsa]